MTPERPPDVLPWHLRLAAWVCLLFSAFEGWGAMLSLAQLMAAGGDQPLVPNESPGFGIDPELATRAANVLRGALVSMQVSRGLVLVALMIFTGLTLFGAARLLWPVGLPREAVRRLLVPSTLVVGVLRVIDGAQFASLMRRSAEILYSAPPAKPPPGLDPELLALTLKMGPTLVTGFVIALTVVMAGTFVGLSQYLGSQRVRALLGATAPREREKDA